MGDEYLGALPTPANQEGQYNLAVLTQLNDNELDQVAGDWANLIPGITKDDIVNYVHDLKAMGITGAPTSITNPDPNNPFPQPPSQAFTFDPEGVFGAGRPGGADGVDEAGVPKANAWFNPTAQTVLLICMFKLVEVLKEVKMMEKEVSIMSMNLIMETAKDLASITKDIAKTEAAMYQAAAIAAAVKGVMAIASLVIGMFVTKMAGSMASKIKGPASTAATPAPKAGGPAVASAGITSVPAGAPAATGGAPSAGVAGAATPDAAPTINPAGGTTGRARADANAAATKEQANIASNEAKFDAKGGAGAAPKKGFFSGLAMNMVNATQLSTTLNQILGSGADVGENLAKMYLTLKKGNLEALKIVTEAYQNIIRKMGESADKGYDSAQELINTAMRDIFDTMSKNRDAGKM